MTQADFLSFYPQFTGFTPETVLSAYISQANARFSSFTETDAEEARRLYTAHKLTLYAGSALPEAAAPSMALLASAGQARQRVAAKKVGEVSVTYASGASSASAALAGLEETFYGRQLLFLIGLYGRSVYIP